MSRLKIDNAQIKSVMAVIAGGFTAPEARGPLQSLPSFCRVQGVATPTSDSVINFEVWIPDAGTWNGKLVATGNGGYMAWTGRNVAMAETLTCRSPKRCQAYQAEVLVHLVFETPTAGARVRHVHIAVAVARSARGCCADDEQPRSSDLSVRLAACGC